MMNSRWFIPVAVAFCVFCRTETVQAQFITNGSFETGNFSGWTLTGGFLGTGVSTAGGPGIGQAQSGTHYAYLGPLFPGFLSQTFTDPNPGESLNITMYLASNGPGINGFAVMFDGKNLFEEIDIPAEGYTKLSFNVTSESSNTLVLGFEDAFGYLSLDDVSISAAASPADVTTAPAPTTSVLLVTGTICVLGLALRRRFGSGSQPVIS